MKRTLILHLLGLISFLLYAFWFTSVPSTPDSSYFVKTGLVALTLFILYGFILWLARKKYHDSQDHPTINSIIIYALAARVILLLANPGVAPLSDDVYRYVWEGKLVANGYNPYVLSPDMMESSGLADSAIYPKINHPSLPTIYPPLAQYLFATAWVAGGDSLLSFRVLSFLFELAAFFMILVLVREFRIPYWKSLIYVFSPLVLIEFSFSSHVDMLGLPFLIAAIIFLRRNNSLAVGIFLALAVMTKIVALIFLPLLLIHYAGRKRLNFLSGFVIICALGYFPFLISSGPELFGSLWVYMSSWEHNGSIFTLINRLTNSATARVITAGAFLVASGLIAIRTKRIGHAIPSGFLPPERAMLWTMAAFLMLNATVYPWYLVWLLPFLVLSREVAFLAFTGTVFLSYHVLIEESGGSLWQHEGLLLVVEYLPVYTLLLWGILRKKLMISTEVAGDI